MKGLFSSVLLLLVSLAWRHDNNDKHPNGLVMAFSARAPPRRSVTATDPPTPLFFPSTHLNRQQEEQYLQIHQRVNPRKALGRLLEISRVLSGRVLFPLVCSFVRNPPFLQQQQQQRQQQRQHQKGNNVNDAWDEFWTHKRGLWTNAERVALGLPSLGPSYVKLGQALATRPDILHVPLADALANLHDRLTPFDNATAKRIIRRELAVALRKKKLQRDEDSSYTSSTSSYEYLANEGQLEELLASLSDKPVAAGSIAQVYKAHLPGFGPVAVKVQRPGILQKAERDATLFHSVAAYLENLKWPAGTAMRGEPLLGHMNLVSTVDEFTRCVLEDMDFEREVQNMQVFSKLYDHRHDTPGLSKFVQVVVPRVFPELSTRRVIVMEWLEGKKLTDITVDDDDDDDDDNDNDAEITTNIIASQEEREENLRLVKKAIECTLAQLLDTGVLHADPHTGNLLKVKTDDGQVELGYLDFGLVNEVPQRFRDGLVCAVVQIVFARNIEAVADLCVDVGLLSEEAMRDPAERKKLLDALKYAFDNILIWPKDKRGRATAIPKVRFQNLLASLAIITANFDFTVPPYFLNNARALATLEGIALRLDPNFNILRVIYPYSINHLMKNPQVSRKAQETFLEICRNPKTKLVDWGRFNLLLNDWALLTGHRKRRIFWDLLVSRGGRHVSSRIIQDWFMKRGRQINRLTQRILNWNMPSWDVFWLQPSRVARETAV